MPLSERASAFIQEIYAAITMEDTEQAGEMITAKFQDHDIPLDVTGEDYVKNYRKKTEASRMGLATTSHFSYFLDKKMFSTLILRLCLGESLGMLGISNYMRHAIDNDKLDNIQFLLLIGASREVDGESLLLYAIKKEKSAVINYLLDQPWVDINEQNSEGLSPVVLLVRKLSLVNCFKKLFEKKPRLASYKIQPMLLMSKSSEEEKQGWYYHEKNKRYYELDSTKYTGMVYVKMDCNLADLAFVYGNIEALDYLEEKGIRPIALGYQSLAFQHSSRPEILPVLRQRALKLFLAGAIPPRIIISQTGLVDSFVNEVFMPIISIINDIYDVLKAYIQSDEAEVISREKAKKALLTAWKVTSPQTGRSEEFFEALLSAVAAKSPIFTNRLNHSSFIAIVQQVDLQIKEENLRAHKKTIQYTIAHTLMPPPSAVLPSSQAQSEKTPCLSSVRCTLL